MAYMKYTVFADKYETLYNYISYNTHAVNKITANIILTVRPKNASDSEFDF